MCKFVCSYCAGKSLGEFIKTHGTENECSYCKRTGENIAIPIYDLQECILKAWRLFYENADDFYYGKDSGIETFSSRDLIFDSPYTELEDAEELFLQDLSQVMADYSWIKRDGFWMNDADILRNSWDCFCELVKTEKRYTYFLSKIFKNEPMAKSPLETLQEISHLLDSQTSLIKTIPAQTVFFRGRDFDKQEEAEVAKAAQLGTAPVAVSKDNRFSPAGISMFYGCFKKDTVKEEVVPDTKNYLAIGQFYNTKPVRILDLTDIPPIPLYTGSEPEILSLHFLHCFAEELSKPTHNESLDYIPTQVFTEYIRYIGLKDGNIKGIKYRSSKCKGEDNVVLFYKNEDCKDKAKPGVDCLVLKSKEIYKISGRFWRKFT